MDKRSVIWLSHPEEKEMKVSQLSRDGAERWHATPTQRLRRSWAAIQKICTVRVIDPSSRSYTTTRQSIIEKQHLGNK